MQSALKMRRGRRSYIKRLADLRGFLYLKTIETIEKEPVETISKPGA